MSRRYFCRLTSEQIGSMLKNAIYFREHLRAEAKARGMCATSVTPFADVFAFLLPYTPACKCSEPNFVKRYDDEKREIPCACRTCGGRDPSPPDDDDGWVPLSYAEALRDARRHNPK